MLLKVSEVIDNTWSVAKDRADKAGLLLADVLASRAQVFVCFASRAQVSSCFASRAQVYSCLPACVYTQRACAHVHMHRCGQGLRPVRLIGYSIG